MKIKNVLFGITMITLGFVSCKDEKETKAKKSVDTYVVFVDSLENIEASTAKQNWQTINEAYQMRTTEAEIALADLKDNTEEQSKINESKAKYEALKAKYEAELQAEMAEKQKADASSNPTKMVRDRLFGGKLGDDMSFAWVNKDNILKVYDDFFQSYKDNKSNFSREDYDEIKLLYEALDTRKNTVEREGLSSEDNTKIASIKFKFSPMFKTNRIGAKSRENSDAKE
jgi:multidrug efflux pump subunit AcrA (membrane-fusion protein)